MKLDRSRTRKPTANLVATTLIEELVAAQINTQIYASDHPRVSNSIEAVRGRLLELHLEYGMETFRLTLVDDLLVFERRPLIGASMSASRLIQALAAREAGGLELGVDATQDGLRGLFRELAQRNREVDRYDVINRRLEVHSEGRISLLAPYSEDADGESGRDLKATYSVPIRFYQSIIEQLQQVTVAVCSGGEIPFDSVQEHAEEMLGRLEAAEGRLLNLARQDQYDAFTFGHSARVAILALNFGRTLTEDREFLIQLGTAALLHDVGKSLIPFEILHSRTILSEDERRVMGRHPELGAQVLLDHRESDPMAVAAAFGHHLGADGRGYPRTKHDHRLSTVTKIVKICDVYEALTAARPYKLPMSPIRAYRVMMGMNRAFEPRLLRRFIQVNGAFPSGQLVQLSNGESARVLSQTDDLFAPVVEVITDASGEPLREQDVKTFDLSAPEDGCVLRIFEAAHDDQFVTAE